MSNARHHCTRIQPEVADRNLENVIRRFLAPFERDGVLTDEALSLGLVVEEDQNPEVRVVVTG